MKSIIGGLLYFTISCLLGATLLFELDKMIHYHDPYILSIKQKTDFDVMKEITMDDMGTPVIEINREYNDEMKRHITMKFVTESYTYTKDGGYEWDTMDVPLELCNESHF